MGDRIRLSVLVGDTQSSICNLISRKINLYGDLLKITLRFINAIVANEWYQSQRAFVRRAVKPVIVTSCDAMVLHGLHLVD